MFRNRIITPFVRTFRVDSESHVVFLKSNKKQLLSQIKVKLENYDVPLLTSYAPKLFGCNAFVLKTRKRVIPAAEVAGMTRIGRRTKEG